MSVFRGASVGVTLTANKSRYSKELKQARSEMRDWERTVDRSMSRARRGIGMFGRGAAIGLALAGGAAATAGMKMVQMAGDAAEVDSKLEATFGKGRLEKISGDLDRFSAATGASRYQLRQQVADVGALLKPMGMASAQMDDMSLRTVKLATDLSSFNNVPVDEALQALRSGLTGETEPLKRFGILINAAAIETEALNAGLAATKDEITESDKVQARFNLIMRDTKLQQGDATKTAGSYANTIRRIQNSVRDAGTSIGQAMLPSVNRLANGLATFVSSDRFAMHVQNISASAQRAASSVANFIRSSDGQRMLSQLGGAARMAASAIGMLASGVGNAARFLSKHETATLAAAAALGTFVIGMKAAAVIGTLTAAVNLAMASWGAYTAATSGATVAQWALNTALSANPIGIVVVGLGALAAAVVVAYRKSETFRSVVHKLGAGISALAGVVRSGAVRQFNILRGVAGHVAGRLYSDDDSVYNTARRVASFLSDTATAAIDKLTSALSRLKSSLSDVASLLSKVSSGVGPLSTAAKVASAALNARSGRDIGKRGGSRTNPFLTAARRQLAVDASPELSLRQAQQQLAAAQRRFAGANRRNRPERLQAVRDAATNVAQRELAVREAAAQRQREAADALKEAAEAQKQAAEDARLAALDSPRNAMNLTDAIRDLERAQAEATETLADDIAVARQALADEQRRQQLIHQTLNTVQMSEQERASLVDQLTQSVRATNQLQGSIDDMTGQGAGGAGGATLDDLLIQLKAATQAIYEAGATEAGNVFAISKLEQVVQGGSTDFWALQTTAQLQGAVGA